MNEKISKHVTLDPKLRIVAEAAYLVNPRVLKTFSNKKYNIEESYQNAINNAQCFYTLKGQGYGFFAGEDNKKNGFYAVALRNNDGEILIAIRGTDFDNFNILQIVFSGLLSKYQFAINIISKILMSDLYSDLQILLGKIPKQYNSAESFVNSIIRLYPDYKLTVTGHSLGGLLAQLVSSKFGIDAVAFDSPGAKKLIGKLVDGDFDMQKITLINEFPNFVNTCGEHIKKPIVVNNGGALSLGAIGNLLGTMPHKSGKVAKNLFSHGMEDILNSIGRDGVFRQTSIKIWPRNSLTFYRTMEAYNSMPDIYDIYMYHMWKKKSQAIGAKSFKNKYPTFVAYKNYFLKHKLKKHD